MEGFADENRESFTFETRLPIEVCQLTHRIAKHSADQ